MSHETSPWVYEEQALSGATPSTLVTSHLSVDILLNTEAIAIVCKITQISKRSPILDLPLTVVEDLSEALLDFTSLADVSIWLEAVQN